MLLPFRQILQKKLVLTHPSHYKFIERVWGNIAGDPTYYILNQYKTKKRTDEKQI